MRLVANGRRTPPAGASPTPKALPPCLLSPPSFWPTCLLPPSLSPAHRLPPPQIWSTRTGLLQASCRGHDAEITDLAVSCDNAYIASSSMDGTLRVWQLEASSAVCVGWDCPAAATRLPARSSTCLITHRLHPPTRPPSRNQQGGEGGRPGLPVSVLVGHGGPAAFVDFHPTIPGALLSASFDGTCRIWRAADAAAPPIVLRVDPLRFGASGTAVTR